MAGKSGKEINETDYWNVYWSMSGREGPETAGEGKSFTPTKVGPYFFAIQIIADDGKVVFFKGSQHAAQRTFYVRPASKPDVQTDPAGEPVEIWIHENRPANSAIVDLAGTGTFTMLTGAASTGHRHFRVDATTGEVFFVPSADMPLLDHEKPGDANDDNIYRIQVRHVKDDGAISDITLDITVRDLAHEKTDPSKFSYPGLPRVTYERDEALIDGQPTFNQLGPIEKMLLARGSNAPFKMPDSGPLVLTYSIVNLDSLLPEIVLQFGGKVFERPPPGSPGSRPKETGEERKLSELVSLFTDPREMKAARELVREALDEFEKAANLKFIEVADNQHVSANLRFVFLHTRDSDTHTGIPSYASGAHIVLSDRWPENNYPHKKTIMHEVGHALNMFHPFTKTTEPEAYKSKTIMSYGQFPPDTPLTQIDTNVLRFMYGPPVPQQPHPEQRAATAAFEEPVTEQPVTDELPAQAPDAI